MADGGDSDVVNESMDEGEEWSNAGGTKRKTFGQGNGDGLNKRAKSRRVEEAEFKVLVRFKSDISKHDVSNPMRLTKLVRDSVGEVASASYVGSDKVIIFCADKKQQEKALALRKLGKLEVECSVPGTRNEVRGVIAGVPFSMTEEMLKSCVQGGKVVKATRFSTMREGKKEPTRTVLLYFSDELLPERVLLGYVSYPVRPFVPAPLRCFKCQRLGHVASVCKGERRCCRCGENHEYGQCGEGVEPKCCNCGGAHSAAFRGCAVQQQAQEIQRYKVVNQVSYAEAVKEVRQVRGDTARPTGQGTGLVREGTQACIHKCPVQPGTLLVDKVQFLVFLANVINCSAQTDSRTDRIRIIVNAASVHLGITGVTVENLRGLLTPGLGVPVTQAD